MCALTFKCDFNWVERLTQSQQILEFLCPICSLKEASKENGFKDVWTIHFLKSTNYFAVIVQMFISFWFLRKRSYFKAFFTQPSIHSLSVFHRFSCTWGACWSFPPGHWSVYPTAGRIAICSSHLITLSTVFVKAERLHNVDSHGCKHSLFLSVFRVLGCVFALGVRNGAPSWLQDWKPHIPPSLCCAGLIGRCVGTGGGERAWLKRGDCCSGLLIKNSGMLPCTNQTNPVVKNPMGHDSHKGLMGTSGYFWKALVANRPPFKLWQLLHLLFFIRNLRHYGSICVAC